MDTVETFMNKVSPEQIRKLMESLPLGDTITVPYGESSFIGEQPSDFDRLAHTSKEGPYYHTETFPDMEEDSRSSRPDEPLRTWVTGRDGIMIFKGMSMSRMLNEQSGRCG